MTSVEQRYLSDPHFKTLVDTMVMAIREAKYTPSELREAAILAAIIYETHYKAMCIRLEVQENPIEKLNRCLDKVSVKQFEEDPRKKRPDIEELAKEEEKQ